MSAALHPVCPACPVCGGVRFERFSEFRFGMWEDAGTAMRDNAGTALRRRDYVYDLLECPVCRHVMVGHAYGDDFVSALYALPQTEERWTLDDTPAEAPYAEMIAFFGVDNLPAAGLIADFGCGPGVVLRLLRDRCGVAAERLLGVDFAPSAVDLRGVAVDLNRLESTGALPCDGYAAAFCTHTLEHLSDPRAFLRALRLRAGPGALLYLEVPDHGLGDLTAVAAANLQNAQHLHYFTLRTLRVLAESCGWRALRRDAGHFGVVPRARLLLRADAAAGEETAGAATRISDAHFARLWEKAAARLLRWGADDGPVALWGLGGDLFRMIGHAPELAERIAAGRFRLIDGGLAGRTYAGQTVYAPESLTAGAWPVIITPRPAKIRAAIAAAAGRLGIAADRLRNPYCGED